MMRRRDFVIGLGAGIGLAATGRWTLAASKDPVKIGFLAPMTGGFAQVGKDMVDGATMYLEEIGSQAAGRKIEIIVEDTQGQPQVALTKARKLVENDRVHVLNGGLLASTGYALQPYFTEKKVPMLYPVMASDDLTQRQRSAYLVRMGWTSSQPSHPLGEYAYLTLKHRKVVTISADYAFGYETIGGFQRTFEEAGGQVIQKIWCPLNTVDFAPYLAQVRRDADAVMTLLVGQLSLRFPKQYAQAGLYGKIAVLGGGTGTDEFVLPSLDDSALGYVTALHYSAALDTPINRKFVQTYRSKFGKVPGYYSETCYLSSRWVAEATKAVGGEVEDGPKFLEALKRVHVTDAPRGPIKLDEYLNPIQNEYIRKVERREGELWNTVVKTYPDVSQFWKWKPEEYLKQPLYTRDYPPCRFCG